MNKFVALAAWLTLSSMAGAQPTEELLAGRAREILAQVGRSPEGEPYVEVLDPSVSASCSVTFGELVVYLRPNGRLTGLSLPTRRTEGDDPGISFFKQPGEGERKAREYLGLLSPEAADWPIERADAVNQGSNLAIGLHYSFRPIHDGVTVRDAYASVTLNRRDGLIQRMTIFDGFDFGPSTAKVNPETATQNARRFLGGEDAEATTRLEWICPNPLNALDKTMASRARRDLEMRLTYLVAFPQRNASVWIDAQTGEVIELLRGTKSDERLPKARTQTSVTKAEPRRDSPNPLPWAVGGLVAFAGVAGWILNRRR